MLNKYLTSLATSKFNVFNTSQLSALKTSLLKTSSISTLSLLLGLVYGPHLMAMGHSDDDEGYKASPTHGPSINVLPNHVLIDILFHNDLTVADRVAVSKTCKELYMLITCFEHTQNPYTIAAITANSAHYFTAEMHALKRANIIKALVRLSVNQINAIEANSTHYFPTDMGAYDRGRLISYLALLSIEQINAIAGHSAHYFPTDMDYVDRGIITLALGRLSVDKINAIAANSAHYFTGKIPYHERIHIIEGLAPLSVDQINEIAADSALVNQLKTRGFRPL
jgi:hypothetical protein